MAQEKEPNFGLDWDEEIDDGEEFIKPYIFEPGDYDFKVVKFERGISSNGNNQAILDIEITDGEHKAIIKDWITLTNRTIWKIASFFRSIGLKKHGEKTKMRWKESVGKTGRCTLKQDEATSKKGTTYTVNAIEAYLDPVEDFEW